MAIKINPAWKNEIAAKVEEHLNPLINTPLAPVILSHNTAAKWYISYLLSKNLVPKVINMGAGVKKIMLAEDVCPHCKGKGYL